MVPKSLQNKLDIKYGRKKENQERNRLKTESIPCLKKLESEEEEFVEVDLKVLKA